MYLLLWLSIAALGPISRSRTRAITPTYCTICTQYVTYRLHRAHGSLQHSCEPHRTAGRQWELSAEKTRPPKLTTLARTLFRAGTLPPPSSLLPRSLNSANVLTTPAVRKLQIPPRQTRTSFRIAASHFCLLTAIRRTELLIIAEQASSQCPLSNKTTQS